MPATVRPADATESVKEYIQTGALSHVAMIMDGNRRWSQQKHLPVAQGHYQGYKALKKIVEHCSRDINLPVLTVYAFSTENWQRPSHEMELLMKLFQQTLQAEINGLMENNIRLRFIGSLDGFAKSFQEECRKAQAQTGTNTGMLYQVAMNYGGRAEIAQAAQQLAKAVKEGKLQPEDITEELLSQHLHTQDAPDPDMVIRTGGESRVSNFLLWQGAYAELCILEELWPEFTPEVLNQTILNFQSRDRRFGR